MRPAYDSFREEKYMTAIKPKFDIEKLNLHYGAFHALKDINMQIDEQRSQLSSDRPDAESPHF